MTRFLSDTRVLLAPGVIAVIAGVAWSALANTMGLSPDVGALTAISGALFLSGVAYLIVGR